MNIPARCVPVYFLAAGVVLAAILMPGTSLADSFNWSSLAVSGGTCSFVSPVENQGVGNTCWAFAPTAALEAHYMITRDDPTFSMGLSEQMLISAPGAGNEIQGSATSGGYADGASNYIVGTGLVTQQTLPYLSSGTATSLIIAQSTVNSWANQVCKATGNVTDIIAGTATIKADLKMYGPMAATIVADNDFAPLDHLESNVGHAVLITGYQDNTSVSGGGYFIVKNSWGTSPPNQNPNQPAGYYEVPYPDIGVDVYHVVDALSGPAYFTGALGSGTWSGGSGTWSGGSGGWNTSGGTWGNGENQAVFSAAGGTITVGSYTSAHGLTFDAGATGYSFTGGPLIVTGSGISVAESVTINSALTVGAPQTWTVASGKQLTVSGSLNLNISPLTITGGGTTQIGGPIHDASTDPLLGGAWTGPVGTLTMDGSGLLILSGSNTYSGGTNVESGILELTSPDAIAEGTSLTVGQAAAAIFDAPAFAAPSIAGGDGVPEPGTLALFGSGVVGLLCYIRRPSGKQHPGVAHATARVVRNRGTGRVTNLATAVQGIQVAQSAQHHDRGQDTAHADPVVAHDPVQPLGIQRRQSVPGQPVPPTGFAVIGIVVHVAGDHQQRPLGQAGEHAGQLLAKALQFFQLARVNRDADHAAVRR